jgi:hypothetical protein
MQINKDNTAHKGIKSKNNINISIDAEKTFDKIQHPCIIKSLRKLRIEGLFLNILKAMYDKPIVNITLNDENLKAIPIKSGTTERCPFSPLLNTVLEILEQ